MENKSYKSDSEFLRPEEVIKQLDIKIGSQVADFGCASGYFSIPFAQAIGEDGKLFALDVLPHVLETVQSKARTAGLSNIETKRVNLEKKGGSGLNKDSLDWVVVKDILFQNKNKEIILQEAYNILKNGGKALIIEWSKEQSFIGPENGLRISREDLKKLIEGCGFVIEKELGAGDFHCAFIAAK